MPVLLALLLAQAGDKGDLQHASDEMRCVYIEVKQSRAQMLPATFLAQSAAKRCLRKAEAKRCKAKKSAAPPDCQYVVGPERERLLRDLEGSFMEMRRRGVR